jgi:hypothetical protein
MTIYLEADLHHGLAPPATCGKQVLHLAQAQEAPQEVSTMLWRS